MDKLDWSNNVAEKLDYAIFDSRKDLLAVVAVGRLIGAHAALTGQLSAQLVAEHGLTLSEYEVLLLLARAPDGAMRRVDLAQEVRLSPPA